VITGVLEKFFKTEFVSSGPERDTDLSVRSANHKQSVGWIFCTEKLKESWESIKITFRVIALISMGSHVLEIEKSV
jgi:hypothetical protein